MLFCNKQQATSNKQQATSNKQQATNLKILLQRIDFYNFYCFLFLFISFFILRNPLSGQVPDYQNLSTLPSSNFHTIRQQTQHYYDSTRLDTVKGSGYKHFKRWEEFWRPRVGDSANSGSFNNAINSYASLISSPNICNGGPFNEQWQFIGHNSTETVHNGINFGRGQGILVDVYVDIKNDATGNTIYAGSSSGGLWRTRNAKNTIPTWVCLTNQRLPGMGVNDIIIDPNNANVMFISTSFGFGDQKTYGMGILKTTNGQSDNPTWSPTGLTYDLNNPSNFIFTQGIYFSPSTNSTLFALMKNEIYKSTDGGVTFTKKFTLSNNRFFRDLVFLPSNSSTLFVSSNDNGKNDGGAVVLKSTDNGETWTNITTSLGFSSLKERIDLAVTNANTNFIIAGGGEPFAYEISKSLNNGVNWTKSNSTINGGVNGGYWENDIIVSPDNEDIVYLAFTGLCKSINGGSSFNLLYSYSSGIVHPDVRGLDIRKDGNGNDIVYLAHDGGLSVTENNGTTFKTLNGTGLQITQIYGFDMNLKKDWISIGCQDLGFYNSNNGDWKNYCIGDGFKILFNPYENLETMYAQTNYPGLNISTNKGSTWVDLANSSDIGDGNKKMTMDALGNFYIGFNKILYRKKLGTSTIETIANFTNAQDRIWGIGVSKSNPNTMYIGFDEQTWSGVQSKRFYKSTNVLSNTPTWTDVSTNLPLSEMGISDVIVDPNNENHLWVITGTKFADSKAQTTNRIYYSSNGGSTFTSINLGLEISSGVPVRFPVNVGVLDEATGGLYIGTDIGVYYNPNPKSASSPWSCFNKDMPTAIVTDLKIDYCSRKILASTFGRGLWESNLAENPKTDYILTSTELLNINPGETRLYYSDITISTGYTFTVKGTVKMAPNRKITIRRGGKLIIDGGKITSTCDLPWAGVMVEGIYTSNQTNLALQGYVQMKNNAVIENANTGINLIGLNSNGTFNWYKTGGVIEATNANFLNNKKDVAFMSYHPKAPSGSEIPNRSFFKNCKFTTNINNKIPNNELKQHITMWDVTGVRILGCTFEDLRTTPIIPKINGRIGLFTASSTYIVNELCTSPVQGYCNGIPTKFNNLKTGIESYSNGTRGVIMIQNSLFNSYKGAFLQGTNNSAVRSNTFNIKHDIVVANNTDYPFGLYLDKCQAFNTEGNQFTGTTGAANVANGGAAGLVIRNTGANNNEFYRSNFDNLKMASQALSENRDKTDFGPGLIFRCNDYEQTWNDLDIRNDPKNPASNLLYLGMKELQGQIKGTSPITPDNLFANNSNIINFNIENKGNYLQYVYNGPATQVNRLYPFKITTPTVLRLGYNPINTDRNCENFIQNWATTKSPLQTKIATLKPVVIIKSNQVKNLMDGGNTATLKSSIINVNSANINTVVNQLLSLSPYLSTEVLALIASQNTPFTHVMIKDILVANPHSARCLTTQTNLDNRSSQLSTTFRNQINAGLPVQTLRDTLLGELSALSEEFDFTLHELLHNYLLDTNSTINDYANYLKHPLNPTYHYQLAELYFDNGDWYKYNLVKDSIPFKFNLNTKQQTYHTAFSSFYTELNNWQNTSIPMYEANTTRKNWLLNFAATNTQYPARLHALLVINDTFVNFPDVYIPEQNGNAPFTMDINDLTKENEQSPINMYPNPAINEITLAWKKETHFAKIKVLDINGKIIKEINWNNTINISLNTSNWSSGMYFVTISKINSNEIITRKIIVNK